MLSSLLITCFSALAVPPTPIYLGIGETHKLPAQPLTPLRVEKKGIVQIKDEGSKLLFIGKKLGKTKIQIGSQSHQFVVLHKYKKDTLKALNQWLLNKRGPSLKVINHEPQIHGRLLRLSDFIEVAQYTNQKSTFQMATTIERKVLGQVRHYLQQLIEDNNLTPGRLTVRPAWRYEIPSQNKSDLSLYKKILKPFGIETRVDAHSLSQTPVVEIKVFIAHVKKSFARQWGVQWPSEVQAQLIPGGDLSWQALNFSLKTLEDQGQGRLLATPQLIVESNKTAEFHSGGEIPIRSTTQFNNNIEWKRYGLFLKTKARVNSQNNLQIDINLEMSSLDQESSATDIPALTRSQIKTHINMKSPRPVLLSGFLQQQSGESSAGLPWLSQIPIFKPLFSSGQINNRDYELVFILYPRIQSDSTANSN